jgi:hypothetical protein
MDVVELSVADKCNAWNHYVHELADPSLTCSFFIDADVRFSPKALPKLAAVLQNSESTVNVVGGMPMSGRNIDYYQKLLRERSCFFGNLYGMHARFLKRVRDNGFRLPVGLSWIDSFLTKAANTDLEFGSDNLPERVTWLEGTGFTFDSLSPFRKRDILLYKNRIARYELGKLQEVILDQIHPHYWPTDMTEINKAIYRDFNESARNLNWLKKLIVHQRLERLIQP